jgi:hypothetical protein
MNTKETLLSPNWHTYQFSNQSKLTQNKKEDMKIAGTREGSKAMFSKKIKQNITHPLPEFFVFCRSKEHL